MYIKSRKMSKSKDLLFSECVGKLESWVVEDQETEYLSALKLAQILSELYSLGLQLPGPGTASTSSKEKEAMGESEICLLYTSPSPRDKRQSRMPSSA